MNFDEALEKLQRKKFDIIVQNARVAMGSERTSGYIISSAEALLFNDISKNGLARLLCKRIDKIVNG